jgi:hypothetical protein
MVGVQGIKDGFICGTVRADEIVIICEQAVERWLFSELEKAQAL